MKPRFSLLLVFMFLAQVMQAQIEDPVTWKNSSKRLTDSTAELVFEAQIGFKWHLYSQYFDEGGPVRTTFYFDDSDKFEVVGKMSEEPEPEEVFDEAFDMNVKYFSNKAIFRQKVKLLTKEDFKISGNIEYQVCQDDKCVYFNPDFTVKVKGADVAATASAAGEEEPAQEEVTRVAEPAGEQPIEEKSMLGFFLLSFVLGLAGILTPCVFPMIPMTVSFFMGSQGSRFHSVMKALVFGFSIVLLYTLVGLIVSLTSAGADLTTTLSTHWLPNTIFFVLFAAFAASFFGLFEIVLPSGLANKADKQVDKGGYLASFFMAFTLVIVSFSCTGPIVGALLVKAASGDVLEPVIGMFGFALAFALPFTLFAIFPSWLKGLPKSGGWMNSVKIVLGFIILAFSLKFLSNIDQTYHLGIISRDVYLAIWVVLFALLGMYLLGKIKFSHDSDLPYLSVPRLILAIASFTFAVYLIPGLFGADLNAVSGLVPAKTSQNFDLTKHTALVAGTSESKTICEEPKYGDFLELPHGLQGYFDYEQGMACAEKLNKPVLLDFKGHSCSNCKKMENQVWSDPQVLKRLREDYVIIALYVDDRTKLPEDEWVTSEYDGKVKKTMGKVNADFQISRYNVNSQPYYVLVDHEGNELVEPMGMDLKVQNFVDFLDAGKQAFEEK